MVRGREGPRCSVFFRPQAKLRQDVSSSTQFVASYAWSASVQLHQLGPPLCLYAPPITLAHLSSPRPQSRWQSEAAQRRHRGGSFLLMRSSIPRAFGLGAGRSTGGRSLCHWSSQPTLSTLPRDPRQLRGFATHCSRRFNNDALNDASPGDLLS